MPRMETKFQLVPKKFYADCKVQEDQQNYNNQNTEMRNPLMFKEKIIKKMRDSYKTKLKKSTRQWKTNFASFIKVRLQSYDQNCSSSSEFICPICLQMYMTPCPTSCGHIFCFRCIDQSIIRNSNCPTCRNFIRADQFIESKAFSQLNHHFWMQSKERDTYLQKYQKNAQWLSQRLIDKSKIQAKDLIDVKDTQYIWCKAHVLCVYKGIDKTQILVHFQGWNQIYNEVLNVNSQRLAPRNFFSEREDIPRYRLSSPEDNMRSRIEYRDYRDRNININANLNTNVNANNQIESEEESNNQPSNLMYRPVLNFRTNRNNPLTIRFNTRQGRDSIFAIRSLIQPYILRNLRPQNQTEENQDQEQDEQQEVDHDDIVVHDGNEVENEFEEENEEQEQEQQQQQQQEQEQEQQEQGEEQEQEQEEVEDENEQVHQVHQVHQLIIDDQEMQFFEPMEQNMDLDAQFDSREQYPFMRRRRQNEEIQSDSSDQQRRSDQQSIMHEQNHNTPMSHHLNQRQQQIEQHQERNEDFDRNTISNNSYGFHQFDNNSNQNLSNSQDNRPNSSANSVSQYISLIDGNNNEQELNSQQIRDTKIEVEMLKKSAQNEQQRYSQNEKEQKQNSQSNNKQKKSKMILKTRVQEEKRTSKIKRNRLTRIRTRARRQMLPKQPTSQSEESF